MGTRRSLSVLATLRRGCEVASTDQRMAVAPTPDPGWLSHAKLGVLSPLARSGGPWEGHQREAWGAFGRGSALVRKDVGIASAVLRRYVPCVSTWRQSICRQHESHSSDSSLVPEPSQLRTERARIVCSTLLSQSHCPWTLVDGSLVGAGSPPRASRFAHGCFRGQQCLTRSVADR